MILVIIAVAFFVFVIAIARASASDPGNTSPQDYAPPPPRAESRVQWEQNHFINKRIHMNDARHERHRRGQWPPDHGA